MTSSSPASVHFLRPAAWLRVEGGDAGAFLQGQFTNDLRFPSARGCSYGLWLNAKGRVQADSFVLADGGPGYWVGSAASPAAAVRARLEMFIIADDVTVTDCTADWRGAALWGAGTAEVLVAAGLPRPERGEFAETGGAMIFCGRHDRAENFDVIYPVADAGAWEERLARAVAQAGGGVADANALARARIAARIPAVPADIGPDDLPNEGGLEADAISYTKGCYTGQEVMARLRSMGQVRRALVRVRGQGVPPPLPSILYQHGKKAGELRSVASDGDGFIGLALVILLNFVPGLPLELGTNAVATVTLFPEDATRHG